MHCRTARRPLTSITCRLMRTCKHMRMPLTSGCCVVITTWMLLPPLPIFRGRMIFGKLMTRRWSRFRSRSESRKWSWTFTGGWLIPLRGLPSQLALAHRRIFRCGGVSPFTGWKPRISCAAHRVILGSGLRRWHSRGWRGLLREIRKSCDGYPGCTW